MTSINDYVGLAIMPFWRRNSVPITTGPEREP
jgi:hypothetical protein